MRLISLLLFIHVIFISPAFTGGYQVSLHSQKNAGMGLIGTSLALDASAAFYNPGAMSMIPGDYSFSVGVSAIRAITKFQLEQPSVYQATTDNPLGTPFHLYATARLSEKFTAGLAINTPYGNSIAWEEGWAGRFLIQEISLQTITIQPGLAYMIGEKLSAGAGFVIATGSVDLKRMLPLQDDSGEGFVNITGKTMGFGFNAGILWSPDPSLQIGLAYRSKIMMELDEADASFHVPASASENFPSPNTVGTSLPMPANLDLGISWFATGKLMVGLSLNYVFWSAYESLDFDFASNTAIVTDIISPRDYADRLIVRLGGQYELTGNIFVRAGTYYDPTPVNENYFSPETPSLNNLGLTTGLSFLPYENLSIDLSFVYIMGIEKDAKYTPGNFNGTYKSRAYIPGIGIGYHF